MSMVEKFEVNHRFVKTNGVTLHIAEMGSGPLVLLLHGFPEFWFSWRHQIAFLARSGYHVAAPDLRGYGQSDAPEGLASYTQLHIIGDLIGLLDAFGEEKAFVVGHDWGAICAWNMCLLRPDRVRAVVAISVPFSPRSPNRSPVENYKLSLGEGFYICRFQETGRAEADFSRVGVAKILKKVFFYNRREILIAPPDKEISDILDEPGDFPSWISPEEIQHYVDSYEKTGFTSSLNYYRAIDMTWELMAPWTGAKVVTPALYIAGTEDIVYNLPGAADYVAHRMKDYVPNLHEVVMLQGAHHFMHQEYPDAVNTHILDFLKINSR